MSIDRQSLISFVRVEPPILVRQYVCTWLLLLDFFSFIILYIVGILIIGNTATTITSYVFIPVLSICNLWAVLIMVNPKKRQKQYTLFIGVFSLIFSLILMIMVIESLWILNLMKPTIVFIPIIIYVLLIIRSFYYGFKVKKANFDGMKESRENIKWSGLSVTASIIGLTIGNIVMRNLNQQGVYIVLGLVSLILAYIFAGYVNYVYRFYLIVKYLD